MDTSTEIMIRVLRSRMEGMTSYNRMSLVRELMDGWCMACGELLDDRGKCVCIDTDWR